MKLDGTGNNVMELDDTRSINGCFSELTVLAQSHARRADSKKQVVVVPLDIWNEDGSVRTLSGQDSGNTDNLPDRHSQHESRTTDPTVIITARR